MTLSLTHFFITNFDQFYNLILLISPGINCYLSTTPGNAEKVNKLVNAPGYCHQRTSEIVCSVVLTDDQLKLANIERKIYKNYIKKKRIHSIKIFKQPFLLT